MCYLRIISCEIVKRKYTELSFTSVFSILALFCIYYTTVSKFPLKVDHTAMYNIVLLVFSYSIGPI